MFVQKAQFVVVELEWLTVSVSGWLGGGLMIMVLATPIVD